MCLEYLDGASGNLAEPKRTALNRKLTIILVCCATLFHGLGVVSSSSTCKIQAECDGSGSWSRHLKTKSYRSLEPTSHGSPLFI